MQPGLYKVVIIDNKPRFEEATFHCKTHKQMVLEGETATAAGYISVWENSWRISDSYSSTLKLSIGSLEEIEILKTVLGPNYKEPYE